VPTVNDYIKAVIDRDVGPGHTLNDGLLTYFRQTPGVTATTFNQAERDWLKIKDAGLVGTVLDDLWGQFLVRLGYVGANDDMKFQYWKDVLSTVSSVVTKVFTATWGVISVNSTGFRDAPAVGVLAPDVAFAGGSISQIASSSDDFVYVTPVGGVEFPGIGDDLWVTIPPFENPDAIHMSWFINRYEAIIPGVYNAMTAKIGIAGSIRLSGQVP
jgi:hypothetical protein